MKKNSQINTVKKTIEQVFMFLYSFYVEEKMSQINGILQDLEGTSVHDVLIQMEEAYDRISNEQDKWYKKTNFLCIDGCGQCCIGFEPDLFECEALYMSAWLLENQRDVALAIADGTFPFDNSSLAKTKTCPFFNKSSKYHCSIYGGRAFICRLFGACSSYSKKGEKVWKPCKFYPSSVLAMHKPTIEHKQYSYDETMNILGDVPPAMSDLIETALSFIPDSERTVVIHEILPQTIKRLLWIISMNGNDNPNGTPNAPMAA